MPSGHLVTCAFEDLGARVGRARGQARRAGFRQGGVEAHRRPPPSTRRRPPSILKLIAGLEDDDDVQNVYSNFEVSDAVLAKLTAA